MTPSGRSAGLRHPWRCRAGVPGHTSTLGSRILLLVATGVALLDMVSTGCGRRGSSSDQDKIGASTPAAAAASSGGQGQGQGQGHDARTGGASGTGQSEPLATEEREENPRSQTVIIKLLTEPPQRARVFWGQKDLGLAPLEIQRPRGSGPLDLVLRAPGYLTFHTRAFTDRDDKITVRLVPESDAPRMLGYRPQ